MRDISTRRRLIAQSVALSAVLVAGCTGLQNGDDPNGDDPNGDVPGNDESDDDRNGDDENGEDEDDEDEDDEDKDDEDEDDGEIHVAPGGSDQADGTEDSPLGTPQEAVSRARAGDEVIVHDGHYGFNSQWVIEAGGTSENRLIIRAADGAKPTLDFQGMGDGVQLRSPYVTFRGFEVQNSDWKGVNTNGDADHVILEDLDVHDCEIWGVMNNGCNHVVFRNSDSHHNLGVTQNTDGFNMTGDARYGLIEGCRAWANGDDGFDTWVSENHEIRYCLAWDNGRQPDGTGDGFKLGGGPHEGGYNLVHHCAAWDNMRRGFDWNTTDNPLEVYNCTAWDNPIDYRFNQDGPYTLRNNISLGGDVELYDGVDDEYNSWNLGYEDLEFRSLDISSEDFMRLPSDSPAIDAGTDVGLEYAGDAPDLGAYEYGTDIGPPNPWPLPES